MGARTLLYNKYIYISTRLENTAGIYHKLILVIVSCTVIIASYENWLQKLLATAFRLLRGNFTYFSKAELAHLPTTLMSSSV